MPTRPLANFAVWYLKSPSRFTRYRETLLANQWIYYRLEREPMRVTRAPLGVTLRRRAGIDVSVSASNLAPGMQHRCDKSADSNDQNHPRDRYANVGEVLRRLWRFEKCHFALFAGRCIKVHNLAASRTYSLHSRFPPSPAALRSDLP